ncbi:EF-hand domain-containing protein [Rhodocyclus gracilis]|uniref:EF-hand domain-containing protein n=1 Tax=Rhodocyclus tenuis TaxID=1066 RepID=A0A6L5K1F6_RHOTE|nr:EF-hand domain-containing protein [Rhodocyclus gracilis]MQY52680.1 EF-hand domain-containing protein [Rhodocyclus gracilis]
MSSISSLNTTASSYASASSHRHTRPSASDVASSVFSQLDTKGQGYLDLSDFESAFASLDSSASSSTSSSTSVKDVFAQIDSDGDGKVTKDELTSKLKSLAETLDNQFNQSRLGGLASNDAPPPKPPEDGNGDDAGLTKDQLTSMASDAASSDTNLASLLNTVASNFDAADTNGDGKVSFKESQAYAAKAQAEAASSGSSSTSGTSSTASSTTNSTDQEAAITRRILELVRAYSVGTNNSASTNSASSAFSVTA